MLRLKLPQLVMLLGGTVAAWSLTVHAQEPGRLPAIPAMTATLPKIEVVRVKRLDPAAPRIRFRLSDGVVDLMKGFNLATSEGIGGSWKTPPSAETFDARYGRW